MTHQRPIDAINRTATSTGAGYVKTDLGIKATNEETCNIISQTFGQFKNNIEAIWYGLGLEPNVTADLGKIMNDPNIGFEHDGRIYRPQSAVGNMRPNNEDGNPAGGCFTMTTLA